MDIDRECRPSPFYLSYWNHSSPIPLLLDHYSYPFKWFEHSSNQKKYVVNRESSSVWSCGFDVYLYSDREISQNVNQITWCAGSLENTFNHRRITPLLDYAVEEFKEFRRKS